MCGVPVPPYGTRILRVTAQPTDHTRPDQTNHTNQTETALNFSPDDPLQTTTAFVPATTRVRTYKLGHDVGSNKETRQRFHSKNDQDRQCRYKSNTEERSRNHCCRRKSNTYYIVWKCVCCLSYPACNAHAPYYIVICGLSGSTIFSHSLINSTTFRKRILTIKSVCLFSLQLLTNISQSAKNSARYHKWAYVFAWSIRHSCPIIKKHNFIDWLAKNT
jgi:hypothetical protein